MGNFVKNRRIQSGSTGAVLPGGDSAVRPEFPDAGLIRYNTDLLSIEYFDGTQFVTLSDNTYGNANVAAFLPTYTGNIANAASFAGTFFADEFQGNIANIGNVRITSAAANGVFFANSASWATTDANLTWDGAVLTVQGNVAAGNVLSDNYLYANGFPFSRGLLGNIEIANTTITTDGTIGNIVLEPTGSGLLVVDTDTGLVLPTGNTAQRPSPATTGTVRFNTDSDRVEIYDGITWEDVVANVTNQTITGDGANTNFVLDRDSTTAATLVSINGLVQLPTVAYTVTGNLLNLAQAPTITDVIDVRFL
jgi:hypothetical protein